MRPYQREIKAMEQSRTGNVEQSLIPDRRRNEFGVLCLA
jgi:hypothetical protein